MTRRLFFTLTVWLTLATGLMAAPTPPPFFLHDGDKVVFYGDSITEQRMYGVDIETYVLTRFPKMHVHFINSGWSGDKINGGGGGGIELRLKRDVLNYKPTVVTIFLGMNDGLYRPYDDATFQKYATGLTHIVDELRQQLPGVRLTLLTPSFFDYNSRPRPAPPTDPTGYSAKLPAADYNATLLKYCDFVKQLGQKDNIPVANLNYPMVAATAEGRKRDPNFALFDGAKDGIHPSAVGHLIMAAAVLKAWHAPAIFGLSTRKNLTPDTPLTIPLSPGWPIPDDAHIVYGISPLVTGFTTDWPLAVTMGVYRTAADAKLTASEYVITEDGQEVGRVFKRGPKSKYVDMITLHTLPESLQQQKVLALVQQRTDAWHDFWKGASRTAPGLVTRNDVPTDDELAQLRSEDAKLDDLRAQAYAAAQPVPHTFTLTSVVKKAP